MEGWKEGNKADGRMEGRMEGWKDARIEGKIEGWKSGSTSSQPCVPKGPADIYCRGLTACAADPGNLET